MSVVVVAAIIRRDERILITRRLSNVHLPGLWEFPGGKVQANETLPSALQREIREELGVEILVHGEFFFVEHTYPSKTVELHFYDCSICSGEPRPLQVADMCWVTPADLDQFEFPAADAKLIAKLRL